MIYIDLDGVIADFFGSIKEHTGSDEYFDGCWKTFHQIPNFFYTQKILIGSKEFLDTLHPKYECSFLTALPGKYSLTRDTQDKIMWVKEVLQSDIPVICVEEAKFKKQYAKSGDILIDDLIWNIQDWDKCGGIGIHHTSFVSTLEKINLIL